MTATIDDTDLTWVEFTEEDPFEPCCLHGHRTVPTPRAVGALYIPQCGRHPLCRPCLAGYRRVFDLRVSSRDTLTIHCAVHRTDQTYSRNPVVIVGGA